MNLKLDGAHHWFSAGCFAVTVGMVCAGHTAFEGTLQGGNHAISVVYWAACSAFGLASIAFAYMGLLQARHQLELMEGRIQSQRKPMTGARFSPIKKNENIDV